MNKDLNLPPEIITLKVKEIKNTLKILFVLDFYENFNLLNFIEIREISVQILLEVIQDDTKHTGILLRKMCLWGNGGEPGEAGRETKTWYKPNLMWRRHKSNWMKASRSPFS